MELRVLRYFLAVAREQSISRAAEVLNITQPTLSTQLKDLEDEIGHQLLIRGSRKVTLTEEGMILRKRAEEIIDLVLRTERELSGDDENVAGEIHIAMGETAFMKYFALAAKLLKESCPDISYRISSGNSQFVIEQLDKGLADFGLIFADADPTRYEKLVVPVFERWGVLMPAGHPLSRRSVIRAEDLIDQPLIISQQENARKNIEQWFGLPLTKLNIAASYNLVLNASFLTEEHFGLTLTFDGLLDLNERSSLCFRPLEPRMESGAFIIWKKYQVMSRASRRFLSQLTRLIASLRKEAEQHAGQQQKGAAQEPGREAAVEDSINYHACDDLPRRHEKG